METGSKIHNNSVNIIDIDKMDGLLFKKFLTELFKNMGYKVEQTQQSYDQGADLIIKK